MFKKNVIWLASYPKSGNTWFRIFLTNLLNESENPAKINDLKETSISSSRKIFDDYTGLSSSDLTHHEIDRLRPDVYKKQSEETDDLIFKKAHDKYYFVDNNTKPLFPGEISKCAIYFIRNPLDVAVSFAHHGAKSMESIINSMNNPEYGFCDGNSKLYNQLRQLLGTWSDHVESWKKQKELPVKFIRYEDMVMKSFETFKSAVDFIGIKKNNQEIEKAIKNSNFTELAKQEKEEGFKEKMIESKAFFRKGKIGDYKNHLSKEMIHQIVDNHKQVMMEFGYINEVNKLLF